MNLDLNPVGLVNDANRAWQAITLGLPLVFSGCLLLGLGARLGLGKLAGGLRRLPWLVPGGGLILGLILAAWGWGLYSSFGQLGLVRTVDSYTGLSRLVPGWLTTLLPTVSGLVGLLIGALLGSVRWFGSRL